MIPLMREVSRRAAGRRPADEIRDKPIRRFTIAQTLPTRNNSPVVLDLVRGVPERKTSPGENVRMRKAFTLIELLVVITIIVVLLALLAPGLARRRAGSGAHEIGAGPMKSKSALISRGHHDHCGSQSY